MQILGVVHNMRLICYPTGPRVPMLRAAPANRNWMDRTPEKFAYRCLPMSIANAYGWQILNPVRFVANWNGGQSPDCLSITAVDAETQPLAARSHFGSGILTFQVDCILRTDPDFDLWVGGPPNRLKDGIQPLTGIVESDWMPYTFTMNWKFTRKNRPVAFEREEPFCTFYPIQKGIMEEVIPEMRPLSSEPQLKLHYEQWSISRKDFLSSLKSTAHDASELGHWQKHYFRGITVDGQIAGTHRTRLRLREFAAAGESTDRIVAEPQRTDENGL